MDHHWCITIDPRHIQGKQKRSGITLSHKSDPGLKGASQSSQPKPSKQRSAAAIAAALRALEGGMRAKNMTASP
jgi:hypothetical protein